jgi:hypothetical protein
MRTVASNWRVSGILNARGGFRTSARDIIKRTSTRVDLALLRLVSLAATRTIELRLEVFNLFNMTGIPGIMQFGIKYGF